MDNITIFSLLTIPAAAGVFYNDVLSLVSIAGSIILFFGSFPNSPLRRLISLAEWNSAPLVFGTLFQISLIVIGVAAETERIGLLVPMPPSLVTGLFAASLLLMAGRWWLRRKAYY